MARRPTPSALEKLRGNPSHRPINDAEPKPTVGAPEKPKGMSPAASREWNRIVPLLLMVGVLTKVDGKALMAYCDSYAMMEMARKDYQKNGLVHDAPVLDKEDNPIMIDGSPMIVRKANPAVQIYQAAAKTMKSYLIEFGLTPASRSKLKIEAKPERDEQEDAFMHGQQIKDAKANAPLAFNTGKPDFSKLGKEATDFEA